VNFVGDNHRLLHVWLMNLLMVGFGVHHKVSLLAASPYALAVQKVTVKTLMFPIAVERGWIVKKANT